MSWDPAEAPPPAWIAPFARAASEVFGAASSARAALYRRGVLKSARVDRPVISVGNLAVGGSGKTPFCALLVRRLAERRVAIVSRGYGRRSQDSLVVVSRGDGPLVDVETAGDEPFLLAEQTNAIVVVCADRARGAREAIALGADVVLLDDGFQHFALSRDVDLVLLDAGDPFGNGALLPRGPLREPISALSRASAIVLNHGDEAPDPVALEARVDPRALPPGAPIVHVVVEASATRPLDGRRVAILSGIARPSRFERTVQRLGATIVHAAHEGDHVWFDEATVSRFASSASNADLWVTTAKDAVRLPAEVRARFEIVHITHRIVAGAEALDGLLR